MAESESLREALIELKVLRERESARLRETNALLGALESLTTAGGPRRGLAALLASVAKTYGCGLAAIFEAGPEGLVLRHASTPDLAGSLPAWDAQGLATRNRRIVDLETARALAEPAPGVLAPYRALISTPLETTGTDTYVLACLAETPGLFTRGDYELLPRFGQFAAQALNNIALERRNAFLAAVIDGSPTSVAISDATRDDLPLIYVNDSFVGLAGYDRAEVLDQNCRFLSAEDAHSPSRTALRETVNARASGEFVLRNRRKDGTEFWNDLRVFPIRDHAGRTTHLVASQTDVTDRVTAERQRDAARQRLQGALASTSEAFLVIGGNNRVSFANAKFREFFGPVGHWDTGEEIGGPETAMLFDLVPGSGTTALDAARRASTREKVLSDGRYVLINTRPMDDGGAVLSASDITQVKVTEQLLKQRVAAIETAQDGIAITDAGARVLYANPSLLALWARPRSSSAMGRKWTAFYGNLKAQEIGDAVHAALRDEGSWQGEGVITLDGDDQVHDLSLTRVPDVGTVLIARDVTDRQREAEERTLLRKELEEAQVHARIGQVSAGLAHDFNNLLSAITGSAELIAGDEDLSDPLRGAAGRILEAAFQAADLVNAILDLGLRERSSETLDLGQVVAALVDLARGKAPADVRLSTDIPKRPVKIEASRTDLLQITMNLVVNAIDSLDGAPGEVRVSIREGARPEPDAHLLVGRPLAGHDYTLIRVEDTGMGMTGPQLSKILKPYFTTKGNAGSGLGLAVVGDILAAAGGVLTVTSTSGAGTVFNVYWNDAPATVPATKAPVHAAGRADTLPLMLVDDDVQVARSLAAGLEAEGFEIAETQDPAEALAAIIEDPTAWGALVTDYDMGAMNGGDLIEALGETAPSLPIVVVSALARRLTDPRLSAPSVRAVLAKPVAVADLAARLRALTGPRDETS